MLVLWNGPVRLGGEWQGRDGEWRLAKEQRTGPARASGPGGIVREKRLNEANLLGY